VATDCEDKEARRLAQQAIDANNAHVNACRTMWASWFSVLLIGVVLYILGRI